MVISIPIVINIQYSNTDSLRMSEPASCFPKHLTDPDSVRHGHRDMGQRKRTQGQDKEPACRIENRIWDMCNNWKERNTNRKNSLCRQGKAEKIGVQPCLWT